MESEATTTLPGRHETGFGSRLREDSDPPPIETSDGTQTWAVPFEAIKDGLCSRPLRRPNRTRPTELGLREKFLQLAQKWRAETENVSSFTDIWGSPAYREIGEMGKAVLPFVFAELRRKPDWWFAALQRITGDNPVPPQSRGVLSEMTEHWLRYAAERGYLEAK